MDSLYVGPSEMTLCLTKGRKLRYIITYNIIWANQKTKSLTRTCNVWHTALSHICRSIVHHFKHYVDTLIVIPDHKPIDDLKQLGKFDEFEFAQFYLVCEKHRL